jgi:hypothetical protein
MNEIMYGEDYKNDDYADNDVISEYITDRTIDSI